MGSIVPNPNFNFGIAGNQVQNNPFVTGGRPSLCMEFDKATGSQLTGIQLFATQSITPSELTNFSDPKWGNATNEDIWAYKAQVLAEQAYFCKLLAQDLANTVAQGINRPKWNEEIQAALPLIQTAQEASKNLCDTVVASNPKFFLKLYARARQFFLRALKVYYYGSRHQRN